MELVVAPIAELRPQLTHLFEEVVTRTMDSGSGVADAPYSFSCGLTGGATALIFLGALREADVDWSRVTLYWGDERAVPPDHAESNYGLAERLLLSPLGARAPNAIRMQAEDAQPGAAARKYAASLPSALDLLILGVGDDGHVCSLFPGHRALTTEDDRVTVVEDAPKPPSRRMTLTLPYVLASQAIWVIATGPRKLPLLQHALSRDGGSTPLDLVVAQGRAVTVFTDQAVRQRSRVTSRRL